MRLDRFLFLSAVAAVVAACGSDTTTSVVTPGPVGFVRFINAVPDTNSMDFRFMDAVEGVPNVEFVALPFRGGTNVGFQRTSPGSHTVRVFLNGGSTDPAVVSTVMAETPVNVSTDVAQTYILTGSARANAQTFIVTTDNRPSLTKASGEIGFRATNLTSGSVDVYLVPGSTAATAPSGTPVVTGLGANATSGYVTVPAAASSSGYTVVATAAGTTTVVATSLMPAGVPYSPPVTGGSGALDATAGSTTPGSVFTAYIFPPSVAGSKAPAAFTTPGIGLAIDRNPPTGP
jgi:hypothetical protein